MTSLLLLMLSFFPFSSPVSADDTMLNAGLAAVDITPPIGVPLGGFGSPGRRIFPFDVFNRYPYAHWLKPSEGALDPIRAKFMVLKRGSQRLLFASFDFVGVTAQFRKDLVERLARLGFQENEIFLSATHTHSGPGAIADSWFWELMAMDKFLPEIYGGILDASVAGAYDALRSAEPALLYAQSFEAKGLQANRRKHPGHFDPSANLLLAKTLSGNWLGGIANMAVHGTALLDTNQRFSADVPGGIERALEERLAEGGTGKRPVVLFVNGAEGDVKPSHGGLDGIRNVGAGFAEQAMTALGGARVLNPEWEVTSAEVKLGRPYIGLRACAAPVKWLIWSGLHIHLGSIFPKRARIWSIRLGDMLLLTWPGEPTTSLGLGLKELGAAAGAAQTWVLGLTNDHLAYFVTPDEYKEGGLEPCTSMYGPKGGLRMLEGYRSLLSKEER